MVRSLSLLVAGLCAGAGLLAHAAAPPVSNVRASQRPGTKLVDILYDLSDPDSSTLSVLLQVSADGGATWTVPARSFSGAVGGGVAPGLDKAVVWDAGADWDGQFTSQCRVNVLADDSDPQGLVWIPAGTFDMGDTFNEGESFERPVHSVPLSGFQIERAEVSKALWDSVYRWALTRGYGFSNAGAGKGTAHPVQMGNWFDAVKWCNARSQSEGRTPAYLQPTARSPTSIKPAKWRPTSSGTPAVTASPPRRNGKRRREAA
jgi:hypothetical protein